MRSLISGRLGASFGIVGLAMLVAVATNMALTVLSTAKLAFVLGGFALLISTLVVKPPQAYWLFLLVLSMTFDITKWPSSSMVDLSLALGKTYGSPISGTTGIEIYLSDMILLAMLLPWLARVCLRRTTLYFPKILYLFIFYLVWALFVSLIFHHEVLYVRCCPSGQARTIGRMRPLKLAGMAGWRNIP